MRFDEPVLLYGAGREARSTRAFLKARSPRPQGLRHRRQRRGRHRRRRAHRPDRPARRHRSAALRHHRQEPRRVALPADLRHGARGRHRRHLQPQSLGRGLSRGPHRHRHHRHQGQIDHRDAGPPDADRSPASTPGLAGNVGLAPLEIADKHKIVVFELSSYQTADMAFSPDIAGDHQPLRPSTPTGTAPSSATIADKLNLIDRDTPFPVGARRRRAQTIRWCWRRCATRARLLPPLAPFIDDRIASAVARSRLKGAHNLDNARLAAQIALAAGADLEGIVRGIAEFEPLPHRLEEHADRRHHLRQRLRSRPPPRPPRPRSPPIRASASR